MRRVDGGLVALTVMLIWEAFMGWVFYVYDGVV
jgi:hypothetical protein